MYLYAASNLYFFRGLASERACPVDAIHAQEPAAKQAGRANKSFRTRAVATRLRRRQGKRRERTGGVAPFVERFTRAA